MAYFGGAKVAIRRLLGNSTRDGAQQALVFADQFIYSRVDTKQYR